MSSVEMHEIRTEEGGQSDTKVKKHDSNYRRPALLQDTKYNPLLFFRRLYHTYFAVLSGIFVLVLGINFMLQVFFSLFLPEVSDGREFFFVALGLFCLILLLAFFIGALVSYCIQLLRDAWRLDEFVMYRKTVLFDLGLLGRRVTPDKPSLVRIDKMYQIFIILSMDIFPFVIAIIMGAADGYRGGMNAFFLAAMLVMFLHTLLFWLFGLLNDYRDKFVDAKKIWAARKKSDVEEKKDNVFDISQLKDDEVALLKKVINNLKIDQTNEDKLNVCVDIYGLMGKFGKTKVAKGTAGLILLALLVLTILAFILGWTLVVFIFLLAFFIVCVGVLMEILDRVTKRLAVGDEKPSAIVGYFRKHCGVRRKEILKFSVLFLSIALVMTLFFIFAGLWTTLAVTGLLIICIGFLGFFSAKHPDQLWKVVLLECGLFAVISILNNFAVFGTIVGIITLFLIFATQSFLIRKTRMTFPAIIVVMAVFLLVSAVVFSMGYYSSKQGEQDAISGTKHFPITQQKYYSFCDTKWFNMTVLDYAFFSRLAYYKAGHDDEEYTKDRAAFFPNTDWETLNTASATYSVGSDTDYTKNSVYFRDIYSQAQDLHVIAVRGTAGQRDIVQDIDIWVSVTLFQAASYVGPSFMQPGTKDIIYWSTFMKRALKSSSGRFYYERLDNYLDDLREVHPSTDIIITGHSLGGGLAKIVGARHILPAITYSSPGLQYTTKSVETHEGDIHQSGVTIFPDKDVVPRIDNQVASVLPIDCDQAVLNCHFLTRTICEIQRSCGDDLRRGLDDGVCPDDYY